MRPLQPGEPVLVWYATRPRRKGLPAPCEFMPLHGCKGLVAIIPGRGRGPKNYGVRIDGRCHVIPRGNLIPRGSWSRYLKASEQ